MDRRFRFIAAMAVTLIAGCAAPAPPPSRSAAAPTATLTPLPASTTGTAPLASPSSDPIPSASQIAGSDPSTARWTKLDLTGDEPGGVDLVAFDAGYVTVGTRDPFEDPIAWFTSDGMAWQAVSLANLVPNCPGWGPEGDEQVPDADTAAIASNEHQVVVVGSYQPHDAAGCANLTYTPVAWVTDDGQTWQRSEPFYASGSSGRATAVWPTDNGWQAVAPSAHSGTPSIWQSADGLAWRPIADLGDIGFLEVGSGAAAEGTTVVSGSMGAVGESSPRLASSRDGVSWLPIERATGCEAGFRRILPPSVEGLRAWVALGDRQVCTSVDLLDWSSATLPMAVWRITPTRFGVIAIGDTCYGAGSQCPDEPELKAFVSGDGTAWQALVHPPVAFGRAMADGPAGVLMIGTAPGGESGEVWRLEP